MVHFCYSDNPEPFRGRPTPYDKQDACRIWLRHYENMCYLRFIHDNPDASWIEKRQAAKEIDVCQRKLDWAQKHVNWSVEGVESGKAAADKKWGRT